MSGRIERLELPILTIPRRFSTKRTNEETAEIRKRDHLDRGAGVA